MPRYKGYIISRGSYVDACDDCLTGWYVDHRESDLWDRRGAGYPTLLAAKTAVDELVAYLADRDAYP
jgi:hypothetical protein